MAEHSDDESFEGSFEDLFAVGDGIMEEQAIPSMRKQMRRTRTINSVRSMASSISLDVGDLTPEVSRKWRHVVMILIAVLVVVGAASVGALLASGGGSSSDSSSEVSSSASNIHTGASNLVWSQLAQDINGEKEQEKFGASVSLSGDGKTMAIGAPTSTQVNGFNTGRVKVMQLDSNGKWTQLGQTLHSDSNDSRFGQIVRLSRDGNVLAIVAGAAGFVRTFKLDQNSWVQMGSDILNRHIAGISLSENGLVMGVGFSGRAVGNEVVFARVYKFDDNDWTQIGNQISEKEDPQLIARSIALSNDGTTLVVSASFQDLGLVRILRIDNEVWSQIGANIVRKDDDDFGGSVDVNGSGDIVAIGANAHDGNGRNAGQVQIYRYTGSNWEQMGKDILGEALADSFGTSVALSDSGLVVAAGANENDGRSGKGSGHARVYEYLEHHDTWQQIGDDLEGQGNGDEFGSAIALSDDGTVLAVGAWFSRGDGNDSGRVQVFQRK